MIFTLGIAGMSYTFESERKIWFIVVILNWYVISIILLFLASLFSPLIFSFLNSFYLMLILLLLGGRVETN